MAPHDALADLTTVFFSGVVAVLALRRAGLPPIVGFLTAGVLIGPHAFGLVDDPHRIELIAELGVALLLFTIGLEFSFDRLRRIWRYVAIGGGLQVGLTIAAATLAATALGAGAREGVFWGYLTALSSTAIVLRLLADRGEIDAPHGRFVVGVLIFQDLCIVPMMLTVPVLAGADADLLSLAAIFGRTVLVVALGLLLSRKVVPHLLGMAAGARSREVFVLMILTVACAVAWSTAELGMSMALGAFLAGIVIAETEFAHQAMSEVIPFRDALASLFFVSVGMLLDPTVLWTSPGAVLALMLLLVAGKLVLAAGAVLVMRFPARVALLSGVALAQVGEFSFVLLRAGESAGVIDADAAATFLAASVATMAVAPLLVTAVPRLAAGVGLLQPVERLIADPGAAPAVALTDHVVIAGLGHGGRTLMASLERAGVPYLALELNPETVVHERAAGRNVHYGDVTSLEVLEHVARLPRARAVALLISDADAARRAAAVILAHHPSVQVIARVHRLERSVGWPPGVVVIAEDQEAAVTVVDRVLGCTSAASAQIQLALDHARERTAADAATASHAGARLLRAPWADQPRWVSYGLAFGVPFVVTGLLAVLHVTTGAVWEAPLFGAVRIDVLGMFAAAVGAVAVIGGRGPAIVAAAVSFVLGNVTFIQPIGELTLDRRVMPLVLLCVLPAVVAALLPTTGDPDPG